jgi:hypothetical protein
MNIISNMKNMTRQERRKKERELMKQIIINRKKWFVPNWDTVKFERVETHPIIGKCEIWSSSDYVVCVRPYLGQGWYLVLHNQNKTTDVPWTHKQQIKNDICGKEAEAVELFPAHSRLVDSKNQYHLWVLPIGEKFQIGFFE